jgi:hypothetical protein
MNTAATGNKMELPGDRFKPRDDSRENVIAKTLRESAILAG